MTLPELPKGLNQFRFFSSLIFKKELLVKNSGSKQAVTETLCYSG